MTGWKEQQRHDEWRRLSAFTLVELITTIVIVAILLLAVVVVTAGYQTTSAA